jgi:hypothetical protein
MAKAKEQKTGSARYDKETQARLDRVQDGINELLKKEGIALSVPRAKQFFQNAEGKMRFAGVVSMEFLGRVQCPADIIIFAQPELVPEPQKNGAN